MNDPSTDIASRIQPTIRNLPNGMQSSIANDISHPLLHPPQKRDNLQPHQRRALKNLKAKKQRLRILPADKGSATVLLSHEQYHSKMSEHISSGPYTVLQRDPTSSLPGKVDRILKKLLKEGKIDISVFNSCRNLHPRPPQLYGLPKIHKPNTPIRPIVSFYNTPLIALHKTLAHYIQPLTHSHLRIRDSKHMIHILHHNPHPTHSYYCSFDIKSFYTSCSMKLAQRTVIEQFTRDPSLLPAHLPHELEHIRTVLLDNGYPLSRIELVMRRTKQSIDHPASAPIKSDKQSAKVFIPYYPHVNKQISSILQRHSVSSACTSNKNLRDLLTSTKSRQPALHTSNVIYQIPCKDCSATYCGQTSRPLHKRISEHERYTRPAYTHATDLQQSSALAQHAHASGHQIDFSSATILAKLQHQQQLDLVEHAAITILEPSLNRNHAAPSINPQ